MGGEGEWMGGSMWEDWLVEQQQQQQQQQQRQQEEQQQLLQDEGGREGGREGGGVLLSELSLVPVPGPYSEVVPWLDEDAMRGVFGE